jgi:polyisoprenyl-teichoic acid--peptidoglycan teichoic acid transferase
MGASSGAQGSASRTTRRAERRGLRRALTILASIVALLIVAGAASAFVFVRGLETEMRTGVLADESVGTALTDKEPEAPFNILLIGSDARSADEQARADTIIVARLDPGEKRAWLLSIPRDTRVEVPGYGVNKINASSSLGGPALMIDTVEGFLDMPVHHYMEIDFNGFQGIVDAMGGIWLNVDVGIDDRKAASHSPGQRSQRIEPGYQLLDGEHALTFVRSRDFPDADFTRMKNQQQFFKALASQSVRWSNVLKIPSMAKQFSRNVTTDMGVGQIMSLAQAFKGIDESGLQTATLPGEWRSPYVVPDEEMKQHLVSQMLAGGDIEISEDSATADLLPADVSVSVRNGGGISGSAAMAAQRLESRGFVITEVGNANQFIYDETLVVYRDNADAARLVAQQIGSERLVESRGMYAFDSDILVVIGSDWSALMDSGQSQ